MHNEKTILKLMHKRKADIDKINTLRMVDAPDLRLDFKNTAFTDLDIEYIVLYNCDFENAVFTNCNLEMAIFTNTNCKNAKFINCNLRKTDFGPQIKEESDFEDINPIHLHTPALLQGAEFTECMMLYTNFQFANLEGVKFTKCAIDSLFLSNTNYKKAIFEEVRGPGTIF